MLLDIESKPRKMLIGVSFMFFVVSLDFKMQMHLAKKEQMELRQLSEPDADMFGSNSDIIFITGSLSSRISLQAVGADAFTPFSCSHLLRVNIFNKIWLQ